MNGPDPVWLVSLEEATGTRRRLREGLPGQCGGLRKITSANAWISDLRLSDLYKDHFLSFRHLFASLCQPQQAKTERGGEDGGGEPSAALQEHREARLGGYLWVPHV